MNEFGAVDTYVPLAVRKRLWTVVEVIRRDIQRNEGRRSSWLSSTSQSTETHNEPLEDFTAGDVKVGKTQIGR